MEDKDLPKKIWQRLDRAERAVPPEDFLLRLENRAITHGVKNIYFSWNAFVGIAASFLLLLALNFFLLLEYPKRLVSQQESISSVMNYTLIPVKSIYDE